MSRAQQIVDALTGGEDFDARDFVMSAAPNLEAAGFTVQHRGDTYDLYQFRYPATGPKYYYCIVQDVDTSYRLALNYASPTYTNVMSVDFLDKHDFSDKAAGFINVLKTFIDDFGDNTPMVGGMTYDWLKRVKRMDGIKESDEFDARDYMATMSADLTTFGFEKSIEPVNQEPAGWFYNYQGRDDNVYTLRFGNLLGSNEDNYLVGIYITRHGMRPYHTVLSKRWVEQNAEELLDNFKLIVDHYGNSPAEVSRHFAYTIRAIRSRGVNESDDFDPLEYLKSRPGTYIIHRSGEKSVYGSDPYRYDYLVYLDNPDGTREFAGYLLRRDKGNSWIAVLEPVKHDALDAALGQAQDTDNIDPDRPEPAPGEKWSQPFANADEAARALIKHKTPGIVAKDDLNARLDADIRDLARRVRFESVDFDARDYMLKPTRLADFLMQNGFWEDWTGSIPHDPKTDVHVYKKGGISVREPWPAQKDYHQITPDHWVATIMGYDHKDRVYRKSVYGSEKEIWDWLKVQPEFIGVVNESTTTMPLAEILANTQPMDYPGYTWEQAFQSIENNHYRSSPEHWDKFLASVKEHGIRRPVEIERHRDKQYLWKGHHRVWAAHKLGISEVPVKYTVRESEDFDAGEYLSTTPEDIREYLKRHKFKPNPHNTDTWQAWAKWTRHHYLLVRYAWQGGGWMGQISDHDGRGGGKIFGEREIIKALDALPDLDQPRMGCPECHSTHLTEPNEQGLVGCWSCSHWFNPETEGAPIDESEDVSARDYFLSTPEPMIQWLERNRFSRQSGPGLPGLWQKGEMTVRSPRPPKANYWHAGFRARRPDGYDDWIHIEGDEQQVKDWVMLNQHRANVLEADEEPFDARDYLIHGGEASKTIDELYKDGWLHHRSQNQRPAAYTILPSSFGDRMDVYVYVYAWDEKNALQLWISNRFSGVRAAHGVMRPEQLPAIMAGLREVMGRAPTWDSLTAQFGEVLRLNKVGIQDFQIESAEFDAREYLTRRLPDEAELQMAGAVKKDWGWQLVDKKGNEWAFFATPSGSMWNMVHYIKGTRVGRHSMYLSDLLDIVRKVEVQESDEGFDARDYMMALPRVPFGERKVGEYFCNNEGRDSVVVKIADRTISPGRVRLVWTKNKGYLKPTEKVHGPVGFFTVWGVDDGVGTYPPPPQFDPAQVINESEDFSAKDYLLNEPAQCDHNSMVWDENKQRWACAKCGRVYESDEFDPMAYLSADAIYYGYIPVRDGGATEDRLVWMTHDGDVSKVPVEFSAEQVDLLASKPGWRHVKWTNKVNVSESEEGFDARAYLLGGGVDELRHYLTHANFKRNRNVTNTEYWRKISLEGSENGPLSHSVWEDETTPGKWYYKKVHHKHEGAPGSGQVTAHTVGEWEGTPNQILLALKKYLPVNLFKRGALNRVGGFNETLDDPFDARQYMLNSDEMALEQRLIQGGFKQTEPNYWFKTENVTSSSGYFWHRFDHIVHKEPGSDVSDNPRLPAPAGEWTYRRYEMERKMGPGGHLDSKTVGTANAIIDALDNWDKQASLRRYIHTESEDFDARAYLDSMKAYEGPPPGKEYWVLFQEGTYQRAVKLYNFKAVQRFVHNKNLDKDPTLILRVRQADDSARDYRREPDGTYVETDYTQYREQFVNPAGVYENEDEFDAREWLTNPPKPQRPWGYMLRSTTPNSPYPWFARGWSDRYGCCGNFRRAIGDGTVFKRLKTAQQWPSMEIVPIYGNPRVYGEKVLDWDDLMRYRQKLGIKRENDIAQDRPMPKPKGWTEPAPAMSGGLPFGSYTTESDDFDARDYMLNEPTKDDEVRMMLKQLGFKMTKPYRPDNQWEIWKLRRKGVVHTVQQKEPGAGWGYHRNTIPDYNFGTGPENMLKALPRYVKESDDFDAREYFNQAEPNYVLQLTGDPAEDAPTYFCPGGWCRETDPQYHYKLSRKQAFDMVNVLKEVGAVDRDAVLTPLPIVYDEETDRDVIVFPEEPEPVAESDDFDAREYFTHERYRPKAVNIGGDLWNDERRLRNVFSWLTRIGAAPKFGTLPIHYYQQDQMKALDAIIAAAQRRGFEPEWVRYKNGKFIAHNKGKWETIARLDFGTITPV